MTERSSIVTTPIRSPTISHQVSSGANSVDLMGASSLNAGGAGTLEFPESRNRRLLELKLLHQYITKTSPTIATDPNRAEAWTTIVPILAFTNDSLLYSIYSASALHIAKAKPQDPEALDAHRRYLDLALREHSNDVSQLSEVNADTVCMTSSLLAFVHLSCYKTGH
jgi:hypothetical protein